LIALATNVVVRLLVDDDPGQTRRARALLAAGTVLVTPTVLLETEWVLRGAYGIDRAAVARSLRALLGLPVVALLHAQATAQALAWFEAGLDFADALHLALSEEAETFVSFDARLVKRARRITSRAVATP
jgi:predicted nucleic-acid-binding protein